METQPSSGQSADNSDQQSTPGKDEIYELFQTSPWLYAVVSALGHELRTPISGIVGLNELLLLSEIDEQQRDFLQATKASVSALLNTLNDVVDLARIDSAKLTLQPSLIEIEFILNETIRALASAREAKNIQLSSECSPEVAHDIRLDGNRVKQTLLVLLNHYFYLAKDCHVKIKAELDSGMLAISCCLPQLPEQNLADQYAPFLNETNRLPDKQIVTWLRLRLANRLITHMLGEVLPPTIEGNNFVLKFTLPIS